MNIGLMGGTFDPIHNGHLMVAEEARTRLGLSEVIFIPAGQPWLKWLKVNRTISAAEHRVEMVRLAIADKPYFNLSTVEIDRGGPSYTIDTLADLRSKMCDEDRLILILGWDSMAELTRWLEPARLVSMCYLAVAPRPRFPPPDIRALNRAIPGLSRRVTLMEGPNLDISSSDIRDRVARGLSIRHLVPQAVDEYIKLHKLYAVESIK